MSTQLWSLLIRNQCPREDERQDEEDRGEFALLRTHPSSVPKALWSAGLGLVSYHHPAWHAGGGASSLMLLSLLRRGKLRGAEKLSQSYATGSKAVI